MKKSMIEKYIIVILLVLVSISILSCEDPIPTEYIADTYVEGVLFVDKPIKNIILMQTQPVFKEFSYDSSLIRNAKVKIIGDNKVFDLSIAPNGKSGYFATDSSYLVKANTKYNIEITLADNTIITGETYTPSNTSWVKKARNPLQYPKDSVNLPDRDTIGWAKQSAFGFYMLSIRCLDTLDYGKYLPAPTVEKNRRIFRSFESDRMYYEVSSFALIQNDHSPVVWNIFKWFGPQEVTVYVPDINYLKWFIQYASKGRYDSNLGTLKNGKGFFGSASVIKDTVMLLKNQP